MDHNDRRLRRSRHYQGEKVIINCVEAIVANVDIVKDITHTHMRCERIDLVHNPERSNVQSHTKGKWNGQPDQELRIEHHGEGMRNTYRDFNGERRT